MRFAFRSQEHPVERAAPDGALLGAYSEVRALTERLCSPLLTEDYVIQAMPDVSPPKWHLAHTTWFFEQFLLLPFSPRYRVFHAEYSRLFNSYYETVGTFFPRPQRGCLSRPGVADVQRYRAHVDAAMHDLLQRGDAPEIRSRTVLGLHHEQQHQELLLTDIKYNFSVNPLLPAYGDPFPDGDRAPALSWVACRGGLQDIGFGGDGFAFDNETPRHSVYLEDFRLGSRLITNREFLDFMNDGGYRRPELWLSEGWATVRQSGWRAPLYWVANEGSWSVFSLSGLRRLNEQEPVCHVSYYEADAYARWAGKRLPSEQEWESAAAPLPLSGHFVESGRMHPAAADAGATGPVQMFGDVWEWTRSPYLAYPRYQPLPGALGEYNGKFMCNQFVLRGGSCVTSRSHIRATYRNFFHPRDRWQFTGIRLADDAL